MIFNVILPTAKSLSDISLKPLVEMLRAGHGGNRSSQDIEHNRSPNRSPPVTDIKDLKYEMPKAPSPKKAQSP